jgi:hypothetical protein
MTKKREAVAGNNGSNTFDYLTGNQKAFSAFDYAENEGKLQSNLLAAMKPPKVIRLYNCFACEKSFTARKMSNCLVVCKACYASITARNKGRIARNNFVEKALNNFQKFLRRRVVCQD